MDLKRLTRAAALSGTAMLAGLAATTDAAWAERIGTVAAANQEVRGTPPTLDPRQKLIGDDVVALERIETSRLGAGQLLFLDQTSLSIAPNSDIVLNEYIYDPNQGVGDIVLSMTRGALRFIGGLISKDKPAIVVTPKATIGIRGTGAIVEVDENGDAKVTVLSAFFVDVVSETSSVRMTRPGSVATVTSEGAEFVGFTSAEQLSGVFAAFEGNGQGGAPSVSGLPSDAVDAAGGGVAAINSDAVDPQTAQPQHSGGASDVADDDSGNSAGQDESDVLAVSKVENSLGEELQNDEMLAPEIIDPPFNDLSFIVGTATYSGDAMGTLMTLGDGATVPTDVSGTFTMTYDFDVDSAEIDFDIADTLVTVGVDATAPNAPGFSGSDPIFGGPDSISASGTLLSSEAEGPAFGVEGDFSIDQSETLNRVIDGVFGGRVSASD